MIILLLAWLEEQDGFRSALHKLARQFKGPKLKGSLKQVVVTKNGMHTTNTPYAFKFSACFIENVESKKEDIRFMTGLCGDADPTMANALKFNISNVNQGFNLQRLGYQIGLVMDMEYVFAGPRHKKRVEDPESGFSSSLLDSDDDEEALRISAEEAAELNQG